MPASAPLAPLPAPDPAGAMVRTRLAGFVRALRDNGFATGLAESADALRVLAAPGLADKTRLRAALRALFASRRSDWEKFDDLFDAYWFEKHLRASVRLADQRRTPTNLPLRPGADAPEAGGSGPVSRVDRVPGSEAGEDEGAEQRRAGASHAERLETTDFRHIADPQELERAYALAQRLAKAMRARLTRRARAARTGARLDLRRTLHRSVARGGVPVELVQRRRRPKPLKLVILLDASGSMSPYVAVFVRFIHGALDSFREASAFVFHTRLIDVTDAVKEKDPQRAMDRLGLMAQGVGGGTRIGESLATFNRWHAARTLHSRTAVLIVSDGYDTGEPELLAREMAALHRRCRRIVWLNPMIGWRDYAPEAAGMKAALPFVDLFAPAHNLESLEALEPYLARL
ncbi:vWA domain-containing protein [Roseixanthobacter glucoisosaccharinicivorans]|uniref:vWA domain-containing protein n=1 Tax=Roseixanthobacter glucoisosaccharinicivorans TaxID=3119923 RepID=UPI00372A6445